jgi:hypothetical protein
VKDRNVCVWSVKFLYNIVVLVSLLSAAVYFLLLITCLLALLFSCWVADVESPAILVMMFPYLLGFKIFFLLLL